MVHLPALIIDLAIILGVASVVTLICKRLKQPVVLGYIIAGFLASPHVPLLPTIADPEGLKTWAEIGVIFLLFALGLEFSFKKLARVGGAATITAVFEILVMVALGYFIGEALGWKRMDSLFLGGCLAISSTTIILRAFEEVGVKGRGFVGLVFGVLIVEDLVAILLLVLLSTVAVSNQFGGSEMAYALLKLGFFLTVWFVAGIFVLPTLFKRLRRFLSDETMLVVSIGLCLGMVVGATAAGFSPALGAFIMGSILAETTQAERIEHLIKPVKDLFAAVFFVSVGMLIDPQLLVEHLGPVLIITLVTIVGKTLSTMAGALIAGQSLRHSVQSGLSLAQIGEFSFIIASLGQSLNVTSDFLYPIAVGVSAITTFSTPYMIRSADKTYSQIKIWMPDSWERALERYGAQTQRLTRTNLWRDLLKAYAIRMILNGVVVAAIFLLAAAFLPTTIDPYLKFDSSEGVARLLALSVAFTIAAPFLWAFTLAPVDLAGKLWEETGRRGPLMVLELTRFILAGILVTVLSSRFISLWWAAGILVVPGLIGLFFFRKTLDTAYRWFERRFMINFSEREADGAPPLAPWDAHISRFEVEPDAPVAGRTLFELKIRESFGVTIAMIERGGRKITAPTRDMRLFPHDRVYVIGTDEQLARFRPVLESPNGSQEGDRSDDYELSAIRLHSDSQFCGKTIRDSGLRESIGGLVVGLERAGRRILNPDSLVELQNGDVLWVVADAAHVESLRRQKSVE